MGAALRIGDTIYLDHQATTPVDERVVERMAPYYGELCANPHSDDHILGWRANSAVEESASTIATFIGADPDEIVFTSGATEANNLALLGSARSSSRGSRNRILVSAVEHKCVLAAARAAADAGLMVETIPVDHAGLIDLDSLATQLDKDVLLVSVMAVNNEIGTIQPIQEIGALTEKHGALFHCDAAQAPIAMALDVFAANIDLLSLSAHKIYGPKGIGCLYVRRDVQERLEPIIYGGGQQLNLRSGTVPVPLCVGMAAAIDLLQEPVYQQERRALQRRRDTFVDRLDATGYLIEINGPTSEHRHPGNANVRFQGIAAADLLYSLQPHVAAATGSACTSGITEPSHVLRAIGLSQHESDASVRFSLGRFTTDADIDTAVNRIGTALQQLEAVGA